eukprot:2647569-Prymnesium_polylepis.1
MMQLADSSRLKLALGVMKQRSRSRALHFAGTTYNRATSLVAALAQWRGAREAAIVWLRHCTVRLHVHVKLRAPFTLWQHQAALWRRRRWQALQATLRWQDRSCVLGFALLTRWYKARREAARTFARVAFGEVPIISALSVWRSH